MIASRWELFRNVRSFPSTRELSLAKTEITDTLIAVKTAEVQLPDAVYQQMEQTAARLHLSVPELLRNLAEQAVQHGVKKQIVVAYNWQFPEGRHLGEFKARAEDWRLLANESAD
jgi:hypothetical protein